MTDVNPANEDFTAGDLYPAKLFKNASGVTVYSFEWADEGATHATWVFKAHDKYVTVALPSFWTYDAASGGPAPILQSDLDLYHTLAKKIADTIQVK